MEKLVSKLQYKNYETGEFSAIESRSAEQTIQLINEFPWTEQRHLTDVMLSCPSVTIARDDSFLKLGPYFNGKFCLYLYENGHVYKKVITELADGMESVMQYFGGNDLSVDFERDGMHYQPQQHFTTSFFEYTVTTKMILNFLFFPIMVVTMSNLMIAVKSFSNGKRNNFLTNLAFVICTFGLLCSCNIYLFLNYYFYSKYLYLQISKGQTDFQFGTKDAYKGYSKNDIAAITKFRYKNHKSFWPSYVVYEIDFKNGEQIRFPSLLLSDSLFSRKFAGYPFTEKHKFLARI